MTEVSQTPLLHDVEMQRQALDVSDDLMHQQEQSPAYKALHDAGLIVHAYRLNSAEDLDVVSGNATVLSNFSCRALAYTAGLLVGGIVYDSFVTQFVVNAGTLRPGQHSDGSYFFFGPGVHRVNRLFVTVEQEISLQQAKIEHGDRTVVTVPQGFVGLAHDRGQPILLAPGMHQWKSCTMRLQELIDLKEDVIRIGPFTLLTVDEGYAAITQDNGKQRILLGGATHMLTHRNWKFEKLLSLKIHTDDIESFRATTADNVVLETFATVTWCITDSSLAARMAANTMSGGRGRKSASCSDEGSLLKCDVLKQAKASLAAAIGSIRYADDSHVSANERVAVVEGLLEMPPLAETSAKARQLGEPSGVSQIFSVQQMSLAAKHANEICLQYGVSIVSISVVSAIPLDKKLDEALSAGAVAAAGAQQAEIAARGNAKAKLILAQSDAEASRINAQALADAERLHAQGKQGAAALLEASDVAVGLARLEKAGGMLADKTTFFFSAGPGQISAMLANNGILSVDAA